MQESQRVLLSQLSRDYLSIGITQDGEIQRVIPIPWQHTGTAYNMRRPTVYIEPSDLEDEELMARLEAFQVRGMYIFTPLEDYSFIARFKGLWDVYILRFGGWIDLSFMRQIPGWNMFHLRDAIVPDISPVFRSKPEMIWNRQKVSLVNYRIDSSEDDGNENVFISHLLVE